MLNLNELEQFVLFAEHGTLLKVSEITNISRPTLTRSMKHVEDAFGVSLFKRGKNRLELNKTGQKAIIYARQILDAEKNAIQAVKEFDQHLHSITIVSCAPAPLWEFLPKISANYPEYSIISRICSLSAVVSSLCQGDASIGILPSDYIKKNRVVSSLFQNIKTIPLHSSDGNITYYAVIGDIFPV